MRDTLPNCSDFEKAPTENKSRKQILKDTKTTLFALKKQTPKICFNPETIRIKIWSSHWKKRSK